MSASAGSHDALGPRVQGAVAAGAAAVGVSDDLLDRVRGSITDDRRRRRQRRRAAGVLGCGMGAIGAVGVGVVDRDGGALLMDWWILELIWFAVMCALGVWLGPFIRRFGKSYAADVFRANPRTGKSFIVLMDVAYYLIFAAYVLFNVRFAAADDWSPTVGAAQLRMTAVRVGGILLVVGVLHGLNVLTLPLMGRLFTLNRQLDGDAAAPAGRFPGADGG